MAEYASPPPAWWHLAPYFTESGWEPTTAVYLQGSILFFTLVYVFETYLDVRQHRKLRETALPQSLVDAIGALDGQATPNATHAMPKRASDSDSNTSDDDGDDDRQERAPVSLLATTLDEFDKARAYGLDKSAFTLWTGAYRHLVAVALLLLGYLPFLWGVSGRVLETLGLDASTHEVTRSVVFYMLDVLRDVMSQLPCDLYATFVLEQRHGINKQSLGLFVTDRIKLVSLGVAIMAPLTAALIGVVHWGGEHFYIYAWLLLVAFTVAVISIVPAFVMPLLMKLTPLEDSDLRVRVEDLASRVGFPLAGLVVADESTRSSHSSALCIGLFSTQRIVLYDTLLARTAGDEPLAVVAHELAHWKLAHSLKKFGVQSVHDFALAYVFGLCLRSGALFASFGFATTDLPVVVGYMLFSKAMWAPVRHFNSFAMRLATRVTELEADAFAVDLGFGQALKAALTKVAIGNLVNMNPDPIYSWYNYDHPPLVERLAAIDGRMKKAVSDKVKMNSRSDRTDRRRMDRLLLGMTRDQDALDSNDTSRYTKDKTDTRAT